MTIKQDAEREGAMTPELKPCPFCGSDDIGTLHATDNKASMLCDGCGVQIGWHMTRRAAAEAWNRRSVTERAAVVEECAKICDEVHRSNIHSVGISLGSDARAMTAFKLAERIRSLSVSEPAASPPKEVP